MMKKLAYFLFISIILTPCPILTAGIDFYDDGGTHVVNNTSHPTVFLDYNVENSTGTHLYLTGSGRVERINAYHNSTITMDGGNAFQGIHLFDNSSVNVSAGSIQYQGIQAKGNSAVNIYGGSIPFLVAGQDSIANVYGGRYTTTWQGTMFEASKNGIIYLHGSNFTLRDTYGHLSNLKNGDRLSDFVDLIDANYDYYNGWISGTLANGMRFENQQFRIYREGYYEGTAEIIIVPEPCSLVLLSLGGLMLRRKYRRQHCYSDVHG